MKKSMFLTVFSILFFFINASAQVIVQVNFSNQSVCDVYVMVYTIEDSCGGIPVFYNEPFTIPGNDTLTYYVGQGGDAVAWVDILDSQGLTIETVDFCNDDLITDPFDNGCNDMYAFGSGNCCGANPDIRDIGLSVL